MALAFHTLDVFTDRKFAGNPLAVVLDGSGLSDARMQTIAAEFNLSETIFLMPPDDVRHTRKVRIFTPKRELPFAGHPTIGAAMLLAMLGVVQSVGGRSTVRLEEKVGLVPVDIEWRDGRPASATFTSPRVPERLAAPPADLAAAAIGMPSDAIDRRGPGVSVWSAGVSFLCIPLSTLDELARIRLDLAKWEALPGVEAIDALYAMVRTEAGLQARMISPSMGLSEDPATGAAAAAVAGWLAASDGPLEGTRLYRIDQGVEMGRPSVIGVAVDARDGRLSSVRISGTAVEISRGTFDVG